MIPINKIEIAFDYMFATIGFEKLSDLISKSPTFQNADYVHKKQKLIIELKVISNDYFKDGGIIDKLHSIVPVRKGDYVHLPPNIPGVYHFTIPAPNREGKHDTFEEPLRRIIKKANKQIKETNKVVFNGEGRGIIIIALNMETSIDLEVVFALSGELLSREFASIEGFLVCDPRLAVLGSDVSCIHGAKQTSTEFFHSFCNDLGDYFSKFFYQLGQEQSGITN
jgi:hypothetical protein